MRLKIFAFTVMAIVLFGCTQQITANNAISEKDKKEIEALKKNIPFNSVEYR